MEHLFKLKRDGKTVGYLRFTKYSDGDLHIQLSTDNSGWSDDIELIDYNSIHPFVTQDKHGKDVFAGDKIKGTVETIFEDAHPVEGYVDYMSDFCGWSLDMPDLGISVYLEIVEDIELIEDKEDD